MIVSIVDTFCYGKECRPDRISDYAAPDLGLLHLQIFLFGMLGINGL